MPKMQGVDNILRVDILGAQTEPIRSYRPAAIHLEPLHLVSQVIIDDAQFGHGTHDPCPLGVETRYPTRNLDSIADHATGALGSHYARWAKR